MTMIICQERLALAPVEGVVRLARALGLMPWRGSRAELLAAVERASNSRAPVPVMPRLHRGVRARLKRSGDDDANRRSET